ncbi:MAG: formamidopyrimidine-DNA glycosylase [Solirubrobacterales bacterium]|nr:MAG: formamidopyrimidine-DNA glycosylase [Solirubrobacterales bacterium]
MPELPEAERARLALEAALGRRITGVDDHDSYVCRPHATGEIAAALVGHRLTSAHRRGKFLWVETQDGTTLGLHLGMAGRIEVDPEDSGRWDRFRVDFEDGGALVLRDKRRLGRAVINPDYGHVGPDAADVGRAEFRRLIGSGRAPVKARLLDQGVVSGLGNLLVDQVLWQARIAPGRSVSELSVEDLDRLRRSVRVAVRSSLRLGGSHTGQFIAARASQGRCPRDGSPVHRARIGGRTTYWCPFCQR